MAAVGEDVITTENEGTSMQNMPRASKYTIVDQLRQYARNIDHVVDMAEMAHLDPRWPARIQAIQQDMRDAADDMEKS